MRVERESEISPERIWGGVFRVPAITGEGTGGCFGIKDLCLPKGWEEVVSEVQINAEAAREFFQSTCSARGVPQGDIVIDPSTKILLEIVVHTKPISRLRLADNFVDREAGLYQMDDVRDARVAIALQMMGARLLTPFWVEAGLIKKHELIPHIDGGEIGYYSRDLRMPDAVYSDEKVWTNDYYQCDFAIRASNIAGRFGMSLSVQGVRFNERGLLSGVDVQPGNACGYNLGVFGTPDQQRYTGHNVDFPRQVLALHGIVADHINDLLGRVDGEYH